MNCPFDKSIFIIINTKDPTGGTSNCDCIVVQL
jgi:hypothetical protein